ncbi:MAG: hypothetical protein WCS43_16895 [Verrucomicrobiota bacterium]
MSIIIDIIIALVLLLLIGKSLIETVYGIFLIFLGLFMNLLSKFFGLLAIISRKLDKHNI